MIEYVDIGILQALRSQFPSNYTMVWSHPELTRQALSNAAINSQQSAPVAPPTNTIGLPGLSVFRTGTQRLLQSRPMGQRGFPMGQFPESGGHPGDFNNLLVIPEMVDYTITVWTQALSDQNVASSILAFLDIYQVVTSSIQGNTFKFPILYLGDPQYMWDNDQKTGKTLFYGMSKHVRIDSAWARSVNLPPIETIVTTYKELVSGCPITLESITIT